jgi:uncharacterized membrane-anchored protein YjiN (DUF445 family)
MTQDKRARLRRMQRLNLALLAVNLIVLILSVQFESTWPWLRWTQAFAEASAIGAIADWYAVVALFRRPLGLPIPHTAIIPRNQRNIGDSLGGFVTRYLLTPDTIVGKLEGLDVPRQMADWLALPANAAIVADSLTSFLPALLRAPEDEDLRRLFRVNLLPKLLELDAARLIGRSMEVLLDAGLHRVLLDRALLAMDGWLLGNEELVREKFAQASKYTPAFVDQYIVRKFLDGVRTLLHEVAGDGEHPLRESLAVALRDWARELEQLPAQREAAQAWLRSALESFFGDSDLRRLRDTLAARAEADLARPDSQLRHYTGTLLAALAAGVARDPVILQRLNAAWLKFARRLAARHGGQIAALISEVVRGWDAQEVSDRIEIEIGRDLQFIRINGALVGGIVGVLLYAGTRLIG